MASYKGSSYYKRNKRIILISFVCVVAVLLISTALFFLNEWLVFTSEGWRIVLPWKDYSQLDEYSSTDDGAEPIIDIGNNE